MCQDPLLLPLRLLPGVRLDVYPSTVNVSPLRYARGERGHQSLKAFDNDDEVISPVRPMYFFKSSFSSAPYYDEGPLPSAA